MKTHYVTVLVALMVAVGAGYWAGQRKGVQGVGADETTALQGGRAKDALLAVADGRTAPGESGGGLGA